MAGVLTIANYLGGPDNIQCEQIFPGDQKILQYDFPQAITNWDFKITSQTIIVNPISFDRDGAPNFSSSAVIGYFPKVEVADTSVSTSSYVRLVNATAGTVNIIVPKNALYAGPILPDARQNVPITIFAVSWTGVVDPTTQTPAPTSTHRWAFLQSWAPGVTPGDPTTYAGYTAISV